MLKLPKVGSILYVEDENEIREELGEVLENFCDTLYLGSNGLEGLTLYKEHTPDIIVTDIKMPTMDGIEMSRLIREADSTAHIIFTTAFSDMDFFQSAIELQVDGYILKPINLDALENKLLSIIENIHLKEELAQKEKMLFQTSKLAAIGEMIGNISHQWKQPLSTISTSISSVKADIELKKMREETMLEYAQAIENQVKYLSKTIEDFRTLFQPHLRNDTYNVKEFIDKCINLVKASFDENTIHTIRDIDEKINSYGDSNQLTQAIINILNNAKDALKDAEKLSKKLIFIVSIKEDENKNIIIIIKDNAGGIPEDIIDKVFDPYFTTKEQTGGTGLGLYITHTIITQNLKGTVEVQNENFEHEGAEYKGAKFIITLPIA